MKSRSEEWKALEATVREQSEYVAALKASIAAEPSWWSTANAMTMSSAVIVFGALFAWLAVTCLQRAKDADTNTTVRVLVLIMAVTATLFLVVAGYSDKQIAPALALMGTIVGYLLGKESKA